MPRVIVLRSRKTLFPARLVFTDNRNPWATWMDDKVVPQGGAVQRSMDDNSSSSSHATTIRECVSYPNKEKTPLVPVPALDVTHPNRPRLASVIVKDHGPNSNLCNVTLDASNQLPDLPSGRTPQKSPEFGAGSSRASAADPLDTQSKETHMKCVKYILPDFNLMVPTTSSSSRHSSDSGETHRALEVGDSEGDGRFDWVDDIESTNSFEEKNACPEDIDANEDDECLCQDSFDSINDATDVASKLGVLSKSKGKPEDHLLRAWENKFLMSKNSRPKVRTRNGIRRSYVEYPGLDRGRENPKTQKNGNPVEMECNKDKEVLCPNSRDELGESEAIATKLGVVGRKNVFGNGYLQERCIKRVSSAIAMYTK